MNQDWEMTKQALASGGRVSILSALKAAQVKADEHNVAAMKAKKSTSSDSHDEKRNIPPEKQEINFDDE